MNLTNTCSSGGWTVFLQRDTRVVPAVNFTRDWEAYRTGFGNASTEYWLGTEALHQLTQPSRQTLHLAAYNEIGLWRSWHIEHSWARWGIFSINSESTQYQLLVDWYQEDSTMGDVLVRNDNHSGMKFSTIDRDNDLWEGESCAQYHQGGGWWYRSCSHFNPTGPHRSMWTRYWTPGVRGDWVPLHRIQMMIRPQNFPTCHQ
ncbi:angiopoietin-related protein 1-like [Procambarus clarkii]|uniref:angiopoietin-related protein 1-like n=1 Tax=Procambarus clarkii TaxID=6728 RepID=UPI003743D242